MGFISPEVAEPWTDEVVRAAEAVVTPGWSDARPGVRCRGRERFRLGDVASSRPGRGTFRLPTAQALASLGVQAQVNRH